MVLFTTRRIKNCQFQRLSEGFSSLQLFGNQTANSPQLATFHTAQRYRQLKRHVTSA
jgi:hypothetical protein